MEKKLPKVFANKIDKTTNEHVNYSRGEMVKEQPKETVKKSVASDKTIYQKLNSIFNSPKYVYKAEVLITTKEGKMTKKIIGKNSNHLITIDNELIPLSDIIDIDFAD